MNSLKINAYHVIIDARHAIVMPIIVIPVEVSSNKGQNVTALLIGISMWILENVNRIVMILIRIL